MKPLFIALLPLFLFLYFYAPVTASQYGKLTGIVTDTAGKPLADAVIRLRQAHHGRRDNVINLSPQVQEDRRTECDIQGKFTFRKLLPGSHFITVYCAGYNLSTQYFNIANDSTTHIRVALTPLPAPVHDSVLLRENPRVAGILRASVKDEYGEPIPGATVRILGTTKGAYTQYDGIAIIKKVQSDTYTIDVVAIGFQKVTKEIHITAGAITDITIEMPYNQKLTSFGFPPPPLPLHKQIGTIRVITSEQLRRWP